MPLLRNIRHLRAVRQVTMSETKLSPTTSSERIVVLDVLRGIAIGGILIGNMQWFSGYGMMPASLAAGTPMLDQATHFLVHVLIEGKFYSIFSFLFGFGFAIQMARAAERGDTKATLFKRRLFWLLVIGVLHAVLLWAGDILSVYALVGFVLILFRNRPDRSLLKWAAGLMIVPIVTYGILLSLFLAFAPPDVRNTIETGQANQWSTSVAIVQQGSYFEILTGYNPQYLLGRWAGLIIQMRLPKILAMFLLGMYAYRRGYFQDVAANRPFIRKVAIYGLGVGFVGNLLFALLAGNEAPFPPSIAGLAGVAAYAVSVPALALGIAAGILLLWQGDPARLLAIFAPVGRMAMTNYLMQTVICVLIFYGYGFQQFGIFGAVNATLTALAIIIFQLVASSIWLKYCAYGPMEWIWRQLTYRKRLPLLMPRATDAV